MEKFRVKRKKESISTRESLLELEKEELIDRLFKLEAHNLQLKNIIGRNRGSENSVERIRGKPFDFSKCHTRRILLRVLYLGWDFVGLASQEDTTRTIEYELFRALTVSRLVESRDKAAYCRCGRTDKGVSSFGQVISLTIRSKLPPEEQNKEENLQNELQYCKMLNRLLPAEIRALCWQPIPDDRPDFSARFDCKQRAYRYYFPRGDLNMAAMSLACRHLVGEHDFRNLCKMDVANGVTRFVRTVRECRIVPVQSDCEGATGMYCLRISGDAFLWHQIRCIAGVLLLIGQGREEPEVVKQLLDVENNPRKPQYSMGLDLPLNLFACEYQLDSWRWDEQDLASVISSLQAMWTKHSVKSAMIGDCLKSLEDTYRTLRVKSSDEDASGCDIRSHADCLLEGVKSRVYKPLMERDKCSSLEERIEHYTKKRRIERIPTDTED